MTARIKLRKLIVDVHLKYWLWYWTDTEHYEVAIQRNTTISYTMKYNFQIPSACHSVQTQRVTFNTNIQTLFTKLAGQFTLLLNMAANPATPSVTNVLPTDPLRIGCIKTVS